jgi:long-chain fatty acid transport protein
MKKTTKHLSVYLLLLMLACSSAFAGGYQINEHGARATGMGGAFVARASDGSAMFFNPAGLAFQKGINVLVGTTLIFPSTTFTGPSPATTETKMVSQMFYPSNLYASYAINEKWVVGLGVYNPYGLGSEWPTTWAGRGLSVKTDLQTFYINPSVSYKVNDKLSLGLGVSYVMGSVVLERNIIFAAGGVPPDGKFKLDGSGNGININAGVMWKPTEKISVGVSYRHLTKIEFEGDATFTNVYAPVAAAFPSGVTGTATLPMPSNLIAGVAYTINPKITVEADFQYVGWNAYDELKINFSKAVGGSTTSTETKKWHEGWLMRLGGEYMLNDKLDLRAGFIYDYAPQPTWRVEPMLPDANRTDVSLGAGYKINEKITVDAAYLLVLFADRTSTYSKLPGTYKSSANLLSVNFGYHF